MKTMILFASIAVLLILPLLLDFIRVSTTTLLSRFFRSIITLSATLMACIGCSKQPEPPQPHEIHWQGPETGFVGKTVFPPDNTGIPKEKP